MTNLTDEVYNQMGGNPNPENSDFIGNDNPTEAFDIVVSDFLVQRNLFFKNYKIQDLKYNIELKTIDLFLEEITSQLENIRMLIFISSNKKIINDRKIQVTALIYEVKQKIHNLLKVE